MKLLMTRLKKGTSVDAYNQRRRAQNFRRDSLDSACPLALARTRGCHRRRRRSALMLRLRLEGLLDDRRSGNRINILIVNYINKRDCD